MGLVSSWDDQLEMRNHKGNECLSAVTELTLTAGQPNAKCANPDKSRAINQSTARTCPLTVLKASKGNLPTLQYILPFSRELSGYLLWKCLLR